MGLEFVGRIIRTSLVVGAIVLIFGSFYHDWNYSLGIFIGLLFSCANLWAIMWFVRRTITLEQRKTKSIVLIALVKFPVLYLVGYLILKSEIVPVASLLVGFSLVFVIIVLKVLGRLIQSSGKFQLADSKKGVAQ